MSLVEQAWKKRVVDPSFSLASAGDSEQGYVVRAYHLIRQGQFDAAREACHRAIGQLTCAKQDGQTQLWLARGHLTRARLHQYTMQQAQESQALERARELYERQEGKVSSADATELWCEIGAHARRASDQGGAFAGLVRAQTFVEEEWERAMVRSHLSAVFLRHMLYQPALTLIEDAHEMPIYIATPALGHKVGCQLGMDDWRGARASADQLLNLEWQSSVGADPFSFAMAAIAYWKVGDIEAVKQAVMAARVTGQRAVSTPVASEVAAATLELVNRQYTACFARLQANGLCDAKVDVHVSQELAAWAYRIGIECQKLAGSRHVMARLSRSLSELQKDRLPRFGLGYLLDPNLATRLDITARQERILALMAQGLSARLIANAMGLSLGTIRNDQASMCSVFRVATVRRLVQAARDRGLIKEARDDQAA
jgi:DNA-binding CsgD family transcriptional regulator